MLILQLPPAMRIIPTVDGAATGSSGARQAVWFAATAAGAPGLQLANESVAMRSAKVRCMT